MPKEKNFSFLNKEHFQRPLYQKKWKDINK
jgi:hypothetical protein